MLKEIPALAQVFRLLAGHLMPINSAPIVSGNLMLQLLNWQ
jgi:hypothetical protein